MEIGQIHRSCGFQFIVQSQRDLTDRSFPTPEILTDILSFQESWTAGYDLQVLNAQFRFQKVHDANCARKGILLYEIYVRGGKYRAVVAWVQPEGPGYWVSVFKKQGNQQSKASLRVAGERAVNLWRYANE